MLGCAVDEEDSGHTAELPGKPSLWEGMVWLGKPEVYHMLGDLLSLVCLR